MNPWQLAKAATEHAEQVALFCYCAKAQKIGFDRALVEHVYSNANPDQRSVKDLIPELKFFHAIPNGGSRGDTAKSRAIEGGRMKAEGVKPGVLDCFWPLRRGNFSGLYIEMKRGSLKDPLNHVAGCSDEQKEFGQFVFNNGYHAMVCYSWLEAAQMLQWYYDLR